MTDPFRSPPFPGRATTPRTPSPAARAAGPRWVCALLACLVRALQAPAPCRAGPDDAAGGPAAQRERDPLILRNDLLGGIFDGEPVNVLALYAYDGFGFRPIPHQFDFIGEDGLVIPSHVNRVMEKAVYDFIPNEALPDRLTGTYELLFMARDAGPRYLGADLPAGFTRALEIRVEDPRNQGSAWVYLMKPEAPPAPVQQDYVDYTLIRKGAQNIEQIRARGYVTGFPDADKPFAYGFWKIPPEAGGTGVNFLQTFRVRVNLKLLFWNVELDPKNNIVPYVLGYNDGPVRVTRRVFSSVVIKGIKMDRFMGDAKLETESHYYGSFFFFDGEVSLPEFVKKISKIKAMFTTDFSANAAGMKWYNAPNASSGCVVDGKMSPQETHLERDPYLWSLIVGPQGGWANLLRMHTESVKPNMNLFYLDDAAYRSEKDPDIDGTWASTGYFLEKLDQVEELVTFRTYILALPSSFEVADTADLVNLVYHPLAARPDRSWTELP